MARPRKNPEIHATIVKPGDAPKVERKVLDRSALLGISAKIAGSTICNRNWPWKNARTHFQNQPLLVTVDKYYPWAEGGALFVDEPVTAEEEKMCEKKAPFLKKEGLRYLVIKREMTEAEARAQVEVR